MAAASTSLCDAQGFYLHSWDPDAPDSKPRFGAPDRAAVMSRKAAIELQNHGRSHAYPRVRKLEIVSAPEAAMERANAKKAKAGKSRAKSASATASA